jgi:hypothetical protein
MLVYPKSVLVGALGRQYAFLVLLVRRQARSKESKIKREIARQDERSGRREEKGSEQYQQRFSSLSGLLLRVDGQAEQLLLLITQPRPPSFVTSPFPFPSRLCIVSIATAPAANASEVTAIWQGPPLRPETAPASKPATIEFWTSA